jgi:hypothetical protein
MNAAIFGIKPVAGNWTKNLIANTGGGVPIARDIAYSGSAYMSVGVTSVSYNFFTATDPTSTWTQRTPSTVLGIPTGVVSNGSRFVVVSRPNGSGTGGILYTDDDGATWANVSSFGSEWNALCYGNALFVAVSSTTAAATSTDGASWTARTLSFADARSVWYGNGLYVAVGGAGAIATSPDGVTWTNRTSGTAIDLYCVRYKAGVWLAVGYDGGGNSVALTSFDGITWATQTLPVGMTYASEIGVFKNWFIVGSDITTGTMYKSISGLTGGWTATGSATGSTAAIVSNAPLLVRWYTESAGGGGTDYGVYTSS